VYCKNKQKKFNNFFFVSVFRFYFLVTIVFFIIFTRLMISHVLALYEPNYDLYGYLRLLIIIFFVFIRGRTLICSTIKDFNIGFQGQLL